MMTARAMLYVETSPVEGREADWNSWYDEVHIPEILERVAGFQAATRYRRPEGESVDPEGGAYCTVYEIETDDPSAAVADLIGAVQSGKLTMSDTSSGRAKMTLWVERTPRVTSA
jgi:hypothetical protein